MTTTAAGGRITGLLALTCIGSYGAAVGDFVHLSGDYTVALADGTKPVLGRVSVANVKRLSTVTSSQFPVANPGGDVTVEVAGFYVTKMNSGGAITVGTAVGIGAGGALLAAGAGVSTIGIALKGATGAGQAVDVLVTRTV